MSAALCHCAQMIQGQHDPAKSAAVVLGTLVAHSMGTRELARWRGAVPAPQCRTSVSGKVRESRQGNARTVRGGSDPVGAHGRNVREMGDPARQHATNTCTAAGGFLALGAVQVRCVEKGAREGSLHYKMSNDWTACHAMRRPQ
jgi:hypothetical protein